MTYWYKGTLEIEEQEISELSANWIMIMCSSDNGTLTNKCTHKEGWEYEVKSLILNTTAMIPRLWVTKNLTIFRENLLVTRQSLKRTYNFLDVSTFLFVNSTYYFQLNLSESCN